MRLFDTHCHLDDEQFDADRDAVVLRSTEAGVAAMVTVGVTAASSEACVALAAKYSTVAAAVGVQPNHCAEIGPADWDRVTGLSVLPAVVAIGETGLDRFWDFTPFELQQEYFDRHLRLAQRVGLPVIVHMRDCDDDVLAMLTEARRRGALRGVMHSFSGTPGTALACLELGLHISFAGMVTYKKSTALREIAASVPEERVLIETDSPYLSPHPHRGRRPNEPALLVHTAACLAETRGVSIEQVADCTTRNAEQLFRRDSII
jgi:TatD DNase family protein